MKTLYPLLLVASSCASAIACSSGDDALIDNSTLTWEECSEESVLLCTSLEVNVDPSDLGSESISLALNRLPALNSERDGVVLINPGGPGASGLDVLETLVQIDTLPARLRQMYDFIAFDPRGVGNSTAVDCEEFGIEELDDYVATDDDIDLFIAASEQVAQACEEKYGTYLQQLGSLNVVHDMESIRLALNADKIHYIGYSYGTRLGALYLQTYPQSSGHFVLDASVRPESDVESLASGSVQSMQANLESMLAECPAIIQDCDANELLLELETRALQLYEAGNYQEFEVVGELVFRAAKDLENAPFLLRPLYGYLATNNISELDQIYQMALVDMQDDSDDNSTAQIAVVCADDGVRPDAAALSTSLAEYNQYSDLFAEVFVSLAGACSGWPDSVEPLATITTQQALPALVIGGTSDAQTPAAWAEEMAQSIGGVRA